MAPQQYCLRWKHHHSNVQSMFAQLLEKERFCDVTLYCSPNFATQVSNKDVDAQNIRGVSLRAHRVVLAACSELLGALLGAHESLGEPVLVIDGAEPRHVRALLDYMYTGEMSVHHSQLAGLLKTAEELRIKGLSDIRWSNKDEPPDCATGAVTATQLSKPEDKPIDKNTHDVKNAPDFKNTLDAKNTHEVRTNFNAKNDMERVQFKCEDDDLGKEKCINGGPPPLIKLPVKDNKNSLLKRDHSDTESQSPKRQRLTSGTEHTDDESSAHTIKTEREEWRHGNLDITAERVVGWGASGVERGDWSRDASDDEWADPPADIGSFLHTRLRVDGDNSADEDSDDSAMAVVGARAHASSSSSTTSTSHLDLPKPSKSNSGVTDPRFSDVVKLNDYLRHGRRPQFWEEHYVKRVMDAVRLKELEMKQAAEILGVSYGTLYGRYRDVYGCINRPYRTARDFWQAKGPSEVLDRLQRGELSLESAALALGVNPSKLAAYVADGPPVLDAEKDKNLAYFLRHTEDAVLGISVPNLSSYVSSDIQTKNKQVDRDSVDLDTDAIYPMDAKGRPRSYLKKEITQTKTKKSISNTDEELSVIVSSTPDTSIFTSPQPTQSSSWPTIRVASIESLRGSDTTTPSPSQLMKTRPDLTIIAAKRDKDET
ncbi:uncharacterized protein LOC123702498 isoform X2 [Colias croceus]|uniref:uncharacterized protein LOC123702498 isoform X2 n=1 Tax=Colias crocea TaxID=72248 RepID=UPI001E27D09F|nr:uncharacterized protein LOC123702498 isoform X2 [Colias croceus]